MEKDNYFKKFKRYYTSITPYLKNKKVKDYSYLILTFFTAAFFAYAAIKPTLKTIISLRRQILDGREVDTKLQKKITALSLGQETISNIGNDLPYVEEVIPNRPAIDFLVKQLENLALANSVSFNSLSFGAVPLRGTVTLGKSVKTKDDLGDILINLRVKGNFGNLISFLEKAGKLRRLLVIDNFSISKGKSEADEKVLSLTAHSKAFYRN